LIDSITESREALLVIDRGGLLDDSGTIQPLFRAIYDKLTQSLHPSVVFVAERMMPLGRRSSLGGCVFCALPSLNQDETRQLLGLLLKRESIKYSNDELLKLVELSDFHPFNVAFIVEAAKEYGLPVFLADTSQLAMWRHRRGSEFLQKITFSEPEIRILSALKNFSGLAFDTLSAIAGAESRIVGEAISRLMDFHVVEANNDIYYLTRPLRVAVGRDRRFSLNADQEREILAAVIESLRIEDQEEGLVRVPLVEASILAQLQGDGKISDLFAAFLLPSHWVWLARRRYDSELFADTVTFASSALDGQSRLSPAGVVEACRLLCLAASRLRLADKFERGISVLERKQMIRGPEVTLTSCLGLTSA